MWFYPSFSATPELTSPAATSTQDQATNEASTSVTLDPAQPLTSIQIRLADGTKLIQRFNHTHRWFLLSPLNPGMGNGTHIYIYIYRIHFNTVPNKIIRVIICRSAVESLFGPFLEKSPINVEFKRDGRIRKTILDAQHTFTCVIVLQTVVIDKCKW